MNNIGNKIINCVLGIIFFIIIVIISSVSFKKSFAVIKDFIKESPHNFTVAKININDIYNDMLTFNSNLRLQDKALYINLNGLMARFMNQRVLNNVIKLNNDHLAANHNGLNDISTGIERMIEYKYELDKLGIHFLYVAAPLELCKYNSQLPLGFNEYENKYLDNFLLELTKACIDTIDLREELHKDGLNHYDAFFKTDHHWKPETGFWATGKIIDHLTAQGVIDAVPKELTDITNYNIDTYKNISIGSRVRRTGTEFLEGGKDDISLIYPRFATEIIAILQPDEGVVSGNFNDMFFNLEYLKTDWFTSAYEGVYMKYYSTDYINNNLQSNSKIFICGDSFNRAVIPFLVINSKKVFSRIFTIPDINDVQYNKPDVVIFLFTGTYFNNSIYLGKKPS